MEDQIFTTLISLLSAKLPGKHVEIIVVVNHPEDDTPANKENSYKICLKVADWCSENTLQSRRFYVLYAPDLPKKHAGAGLARKIGMDEAVRRFNAIDRPEGLILSLDADTTVDKNYFTEIERMLRNEADSDGCIIYFEHPFRGKNFNGKIHRAIVKYELYLRYYHHALQFIGYPFDQYTIGSCFGVRASVYAAQGGMNRRQAGEDFYFLHKLFPNRQLINITGTCVYPSPRPSFRVPFGTGPVIKRLMSGEQDDLYTYHPGAFEDLSFLIREVPSLYGENKKLNKVTASFPDSVKRFLNLVNFNEKISEINKNTATLETFRKRFFQWFDGFMVVKYLNFSHTDYYSKLPVCDTVKMLLEIMGKNAADLSEVELLLLFRKADKENRSIGSIF